MSCPFVYGSPVPPALFVGRQAELRFIEGRLASGGQSTALIGEARIGKSSVLHYLRERGLSTQSDQKMVFSYVDAQSLGSIQPVQFWRIALYPLHDEIERSGSAALRAAWRGCTDSGYEMFYIHKLREAMGDERWRLVLLLDEFDDLFYNHGLANADFFGGLRSLTQVPWPVAVVLASRCTLSHLYETAHKICPLRTSSPFFNFAVESRLGVFEEGDVHQLLGLGARHLGAAEQQRILDLSGGHPYLVQVAAATCWQAKEDGWLNAAGCLEQMEDQVYRAAARLLDDCWLLWPHALRRSFALVAISQYLALPPTERATPRLPFLRSQMQDGVEKFDPSLYGEELRLLTEQGFLAPDPSLCYGHRVRTPVFLRCLADHMAPAARAGHSLETWLYQQAKEVPHAPPLAPQPRPGAPARSLHVFLSSVWQDRHHRARLEVHLRTLIGQGRLWIDENFQPGDADLIFLLLSPDYVASRYHWSVELPWVQNLYQQERARVIPVLLGPVDLQGLDLNDLQMLPRHGGPISRWPNPDEAWAEVAREIRHLVDGLFSWKHR